MNLNEAKNKLRSNGYLLIKESESDIFMEIEDELELEGYDANEIANIMSEYSVIIADLVEEGNTVDEIVYEILYMIKCNRRIKNVSKRS